MQHMTTEHGMNESQWRADHSIRRRMQKNTEFGKHTQAYGVADEHLQQLHKRAFTRSEIQW